MYKEVKGMAINYKELERAYNNITWHAYTILTPRGLTVEDFAFGPPEPDPYEKFRAWALQIHEAGQKEAKRPKNAGLRRFLATNRWERR